MKAIHWAFCFLYLIMMACGKVEEKVTAEHKILPTADFFEIIQHEDVLLVDVRTPGEYKAGFIKGAVNINFADKSFTKKMKYFDRETPVALYCRIGWRKRQSLRGVEITWLCKDI
ncbi:rhodanese-like domain-containing protein [Fulvivirga sp. M361]|uniref:rhodanese-like domain-containing protein n=1 Tax=Fulvivirga sp. M361 TaxID=2594266 RepID=UPI00117A585C|nr:rhodanese-like domain-containing protein [Fulvivirga sp. M361]TRX51290.1 rhodanese-like domain-containing protein [Fulvivirga sp. M361]